MAKNKENDLVIIGTTGSSGLETVLFGSVAQRIIRETIVPVLAIPRNSTFRKIEELVLAVDGKNRFSQISLSPIHKIQHIFNTHIDVLTVQKENVQINFEALGIDFEDVHYSKLEEDDVAAAVKGFCDLKEAQILSVLPQHSGFFERLFHHSISQELIKYASLPILALEKD